MTDDEFADDVARLEETLILWQNACPRFAEFYTTHRPTIDRKLRDAKSIEDKRDVLSELEIVLRLLTAR